ncbi:MAG: hypothetical protein E7773_14175 [Sphingomonas sp.]|uniref:hypothetical protein n=1 Tax=Sphingomonas sp. TaxID=28214 RepID=UPI0012012D5B|nr:hypothetical protein [Sphingomonas sp.]THD34802.1 MAG: hypothetical protein E7773_14175 [Sphingomonas sp.]
MRVDPTNHPQYDTILAVAAAVMAAERDTDASIKALSQLVSTTIDEFAEARLPAGLSQRALDKLASSIAGQIESRRLLTEAHREFGRAAKALGATADGWGPTWPCYTVEEAVKPKRAPLRRVA